MGLLVEKRHTSPEPSRAFSTNGVNQPDTKQAREHMQLLGRDLKQTIWQTWPDKNTKAGYAHTGTDRKKLGEASSAGSNVGFALAKFPAGTLNGHATRGVEFIREKNGFYDVLAAEWDDGSSLEEQLDRITEAQLPEPSVVVFTGGKSHHHYWLLDVQISMEQFGDLQGRLAQALGSDATITTGDQVLRLAGFPHSSTGELARVVRPVESDTAARYALDEFSDLPELPKKTQQVTTPNTDTQDDLCVAIRKFLHPVAEQFSSYEDWLKTGMAFHSLGDGHLRTWVDFCREMSNFDESECLEKWQSFSNREGGITSGSLYYWLAREGWRSGDQIKAQHAIGVRLELLKEGLREITRNVTTAWKRRAHANDLNEALGKLQTYILDAALLEAIAAVREERSKTSRRASRWDAFIGEAEESSVVDWIVHGVIVKGDSHLLVAPAKEGKTSSLAALLMGSWFGPSQSEQERPGSLIWYSDDQDRKKTQSYLLAAARGVRPDGQDLLRERFEHGQLIVDDRFNMTADGFEELTEEVRKADRPVVVIDSLASVCRKLGLKENDSSFANTIYDLGEAVKEANPDATLVIIHHATKGGTKNRGALESVRGSGAIVGAVDNVVNISKPLKTSRGGNSVVADDDTTEREIRVNGRCPSSKSFIDLEFTMILQDDPERPGKAREKLDTITATWKAESTYQEGTEASLGSFQEVVLKYLQTYSDQEWTTSMIGADLEKDSGQISRALTRLVAIGKVVKRREGREVFYQATASL